MGDNVGDVVGKLTCTESYVGSIISAPPLGGQGSAIRRSRPRHPRMVSGGGGHICSIIGPSSSRPEENADQRTLLKALSRN